MRMSIILLFSLFLSLCIACKELFIPKVDKTQKEILVVEGKLTNIDDTIQIRLTKAIGFNDDQNAYDSIHAEKKAIVTISDNFGNKISMKEMGNGYYKAFSYPGYIGRTYTLYIKTQDGNEYESEPETIMPPPDNVSFTTEIGSKGFLFIDAYGQSSTKQLNGVYIFVDVKTSENDKIFYKFNNRKITENKYIVKTDEGGSSSTYCLEVGDLNPKLTIAQADLDNGTREIKHYNLGFIPQIHNDWTDGAPNTVGCLLSCTVSRISEKEYFYYSKFRDQLNAESKIFDPLPTQLVGNIKCITDNTKVVLGYFSVSSEFTIDYYERFNEGYISAIFHSINPLPRNISSTCVPNYAPYIWITN